MKKRTKIILGIVAGIILLSIISSLSNRNKKRLYQEMVMYLPVIY